MIDVPPADSIDSIELVCLEHLDIGFTAAPQEIARREKEHLDAAIALCRERPDFRWTVESIWQLEQWLARTSDEGRAQRDELIALVQEGRIEIAGGFANLHTGVMDAELLLRSFEPAEAIRRELGVAITTCVQDDVPGFCALLPTAMAGSGIRHFLAGVNTSFGGGTSIGPGKNPFYWEGLDGSRVLTWVAYGSYVEAEKIGLGVWSKDGEADEKLPGALKLVEAAGFPFHRTLVMASTGDNGDPNAARSILRKVDAWNAAHTSPKIRFTTPGEFLTTIEHDAAAMSPPHVFPTYRGDWSGHWEPVKASAPAAFALYRDAQALLPGAEALSLRASHEVGIPYPRHDLDVAFRNLLTYSEHSQPGGVGWPGLTTRAEIEATARYSYALAFDANEAVKSIVERVTDRYAERGASETEMETTANPLSFSRTCGDSRFAAGWSIRSAPYRFLGKTIVGGYDSPAVEVLLLSPFDKGGVPTRIDEALHRLSAPQSFFNDLLLIDLLPIDNSPPAFDPARVFAHYVATTFLEKPRKLRFTTAGGVISLDDFLPGSVPRSFATTGAIALEVPGHHELDPLFIRVREAALFQYGAPGWIGTTERSAKPEELWIHLLDRPVAGKTKARNESLDGFGSEVLFDRVEPCADRHFEFNVAAQHGPAVGKTEDADLMRAAADFRCPLVTRWFHRVFPNEPQHIGDRPFFSITCHSDDPATEPSAPNLLALACHPAHFGDPADVILRVQEIGDLAATDADVSLTLPGCDFARRCDLLEAPLAGAKAESARPLHVTLRAHEVITLRFSRQ